MKKVNEYLDSYFKDRREERSVLLYKIYTPEIEREPKPDRD